MKTHVICMRSHYCTISNYSDFFEILKNLRKSKNREKKESEVKRKKVTGDAVTAEQFGTSHWNPSEIVNVCRSKTLTFNPTYCKCFEVALCPIRVVIPCQILILSLQT